jgi:hypothetical protein
LASLGGITCSSPPSPPSLSLWPSSPPTTAAPIEIESRQTTSSSSSNFAFAIQGGRFDLNYLQTFQLSYANSSAWLGQIKYQEYSELLVVSGIDVAGTSDGLAFRKLFQSFGDDT